MQPKAQHTAKALWYVRKFCGAGAGYTLTHNGKIRGNMDENTNTNIEQTTTQTETKPAEERLFTQAELDKIVKQRIARERAKEPPAAPAINEAELTARSNRLDCKEYVLNNGLSTDLLDVIDTNDVNAFIAKVEKLQSIAPAKGSYPEVEDRGEVLHVSDPGEAIRNAFANKKHKPKDW